MEELKTKLKNIQNGTKYITNIINIQELNQEFKNEELELLLKNHPNIEGKGLKELEYLKVKLISPYNTRGLYIKSLNSEYEEDISYKKCIKNLFGKYDLNDNKYDKIKQMFRSIIYEGCRRIYYMENTINGEGECENCNKNELVDIDHYKISFQQILDSYLKFKDINDILEEIKIESNQLCLNNENINEEWKKYHDSIVDYRLLCRSCNSSFGSYGYVSEYVKKKKCEKENKVYYVIIINDESKIKNGIYEKWDKNFSYAQIKQKFENKIDAEEYYKEKTKYLNKEVKTEIIKIYLNVPYSEKEEVKRLGGKWDNSNQKWYIYDNNKDKEDIIKKYGKK